MIHVLMTLACVGYGGAYAVHQAKEKHYGASLLLALVAIACVAVNIRALM